MADHSEVVQVLVERATLRKKRNKTDADKARILTLESQIICCYADGSLTDRETKAARRIVFEKLYRPKKETT